MLPRPQATSTDYGGPRTYDLSIDKQRRNRFKAATLHHRNVFFKH